jgi:hypothetical protein
MENSHDVHNLYCEKCGAPSLIETVYPDRIDARILAERQHAGRDFLSQINKELETFPCGFGRLVLLIWWGIPELVLAGIWLFPGKLHFLLWIAMVVASEFVSIVIASGLRVEYRRKTHVNRLAKGKKSRKSALLNNIILYLRASVCSGGAV